MQKQREKFLSQYWAFKTSNNSNCQPKSLRGSYSITNLQKPHPPALTTIKTKDLPSTIQCQKYTSLHNSDNPHPHFEAHIPPHYQCPTYPLIPKGTLPISIMTMHFLQLWDKNWPTKLCSITVFHGQLHEWSFHIYCWKLIRFPPFGCFLKKSSQVNRWWCKRHMGFPKKKEIYSNFVLTEY